MRYLLDTCIVSETNKRLPNVNLRQWLSGVSMADLFVSVLTIGELRSGVRSAKDAELRQKLEVWLEGTVVPRFEGRILDIDVDIADRWGCLMGDGTAKGRTPSVADSLIAATALSHGMTMVTRNVKDFQFEGLTVINPFEDQSAKTAESTVKHKPIF